MAEFLVAAVAVLGATALIFCYLVFIWWLDRYEREPFWLVIVAFIFGGLFGTFFGGLMSAVPSLIVFALFGEGAGVFASTVIFAPLLEELSKGALFLGLLLSRNFDNETDGLIYGAAVGLGFAAVENLLYFAGTSSVEELVGLAIMRTLFTALVHCSSSAVLGMAFGYARRRGLGKGVLAVGFGYVVAVGNHGLWNLLATLSGFAATDGNEFYFVFSLAGCGIVALVALVMFGLTQFSLKREHDMIKRHLADEAQRGTIPAAHVDVIPYWLRRRKRGWLPPEVSRNAYVKAATLLAFRQHQLEDASGGRRESILRDIEKYRSEVAQLLRATA